MKQDSSAPNVQAEAIQIVPRLLPRAYESTSKWNRAWIELRTLATEEHRAEIILVVLTFLLGAVLLAAVDHAVEHPGFSAPPHVPIWMTQLAER